jgi:hypothetical protein
VSDATRGEGRGRYARPRGQPRPPPEPRRRRGTPFERSTAPPPSENRPVPDVPTPDSESTEDELSRSFLGGEPSQGRSPFRSWDIGSPPPPERQSRSPSPLRRASGSVLPPLPPVFPPPAVAPAASAMATMQDLTDALVALTRQQRDLATDLRALVTALTPAAGAAVAPAAIHAPRPPVPPNYVGEQEKVTAMVNALGLWTRSIADIKEKVQNALVFFTEG